MLNTLYRKLKYRIWLIWGLIKYGNFAALFPFVYFTARRIQKQLSVTIAGEEVTIRTATPDLDVTLHCFEGEFAAANDAASPPYFRAILDGGGYIGTAAIAFAKAFPESQIITVEPSTENFALLKKNTAKFKNIKPLQAGLYSSVGHMELKDPGSREWGFTLVDTRGGDKEPKNVERIKVTTIDQIMKDHGVSGLDIVKLDIEGGEYELFRHKPDWVKNVNVIVVELHDTVQPGCSKVFEDATTGRKRSELGHEKIMSVKS